MYIDPAELEPANSDEPKESEPDWTDIETAATYPLDEADPYERSTSNSYLGDCVCDRCNSDRIDPR